MYLELLHLVLWNCCIFCSVASSLELSHVCWHFFESFWKSLGKGHAVFPASELGSLFLFPSNMFFVAFVFWSYFGMFVLKLSKENILLVGVNFFFLHRFFLYRYYVDVFLMILLVFCFVSPLSFSVLFFFAVFFGFMFVFGVFCCLTIWAFLRFLKESCSIFEVGQYPSKGMIFQSVVRNRGRQATQMFAAFVCAKPKRA